MSQKNCFSNRQFTFNKGFSPNTHFLVFLGLFARFYGLGDDGLGIVSWGMSCDGSP